MYLWTRIWAGLFEVLFAAGERVFLSFKKLADSLWDRPSSCGYRTLFPGCEAEHSAPSRAEVKSEQRYACTPHMCLHGLQRDNFTSLPLRVT